MNLFLLFSEMEEKISELVVVIYLGKNWWGSPSFVRCWPVWMIESLVCHSGAAWWWGDVTLGLSKGAGMVSLSIDWTHSLCSTRQATYFRVARGSHLQLYPCCFVPRRVMSRPPCTQLANPAVSLVIPFVSLTGIHRWKFLNFYISLRTVSSYFPGFS